MGKFFYAAIFAALLLSACSQPADTKSANENLSATAPVVVEAKKKEIATPDLDMSLALYTRRLNRSFEEYELPWHVSDAKFFEGKVTDSYTAPIGKYAVLSVSVTKKKQLVSVTVMTSGDGTKSSGSEVLIAASAALSAAAPRTELKDVLNVMPQLVSGESIDAGGVVFRAKNMDSLGLWFFAEPK